MDMVKWLIVMEIFMKVNDKMIKLKDMEYIYTVMGLNMKEID